MRYKSNGFPSGMGRLRLKLDTESWDKGRHEDDLTVLAAGNDPYRMGDTDDRTDAGEWVADGLRELDAKKGSGRKYHPRGLHYAFLGREKPNGLPYGTPDAAADWVWLEKAVKIARWLEYVPFDRIVDERSDEPVLQEWSAPHPEPTAGPSEFHVRIPDRDDLAPRAGIRDRWDRHREGFEGSQPYNIVLVGEKSSLREILTGLARRYEADVYLPTGEISIVHAERMAAASINDGRPLRVMYFADFDPGGWQMPTSLIRKLQALKDLDYSELDFKVYRVGLTKRQAIKYGLPSSPLKPGEARGDAWFTATGREQTEIDALATLQPEVLITEAQAFIDPFFDFTLADRVADAKDEWLSAAQQMLDERDGDEGRAHRDAAAKALARHRSAIEKILADMVIDADDVEFPDVVIPDALIDEDAQPEPMCDSGWSFFDQCQALKASKRYEDTDD